MVRLEMHGKEAPAKSEDNVVWVWSRSTTAPLLVAVMVVSFFGLLALAAYMATAQDGDAAGVAGALVFASIAMIGTLYAIMQSTVRIDSSGLRRGFPWANAIAHEDIAAFDLDARTQSQLIVVQHDGTTSVAYRYCRLKFHPRMAPTIANTMFGQNRAYTKVIDTCREFTGVDKHTENSVLTFLG